MLNAETLTAAQDQRISDAIAREQARLRNFIRERVPDIADAEDILQDVFYELVEAYRLSVVIRSLGSVGKMTRILAILRAIEARAGNNCRSDSRDFLRCSLEMSTSAYRGFRIVIAADNRAGHDYSVSRAA